MAAATSSSRCPSRTPPSLARSVDSWLTYRVVIVSVPRPRRPHPDPCALGRVLGPRPSLGAVEPLLGMPRYRTVKLLVAAPKHAAFVLSLPMLLDDPRIRVEVVRGNRPANTRLVQARPDGVVETRVTRREYVAQARSMRTSSEHEGQRDGHGLHGVSVRIRGDGAVWCRSASSRSSATRMSSASTVHARIATPRSRG